jgi:hypothetical protein
LPLAGRRATARDTDAARLPVHRSGETLTQKGINAMRGLMISGMGFVLLVAVVGCHTFHGVCDCDPGNYGCNYDYGSHRIPANVAKPATFMPVPGAPATGAPATVAPAEQIKVMPKPNGL